MLIVDFVLFRIVTRKTYYNKVSCRFFTSNITIRGTKSRRLKFRTYIGLHLRHQKIHSASIIWNLTCDILPVIILRNLTYEFFMCTIVSFLAFFGNPRRSLSDFEESPVRQYNRSTIKGRRNKCARASSNMNE